MFIVVSFLKARKAPEERHVSWRLASTRSMPLLRSLAGTRDGHCYKHGAPNGACRLASAGRGRDELVSSLASPASHGCGAIPLQNSVEGAVKACADKPNYRRPSPSP